jgi:hypothetical protein
VAGFDAAVAVAVAVSIGAGHDVDGRSVALKDPVLQTLI